MAATTRDKAHKENSYGRIKCNALAHPSTRSLLAGTHLCNQISALLLVEPKVARQVFLGEPVEEVLAMVEWALKHEGEAGFDPEKILPAWAQKRGRGYWRTENRWVEECGQCHGSGSVPGPFKSSEGA